MGSKNPERLWSKVIITPGCWLWTGRQNTDGYGKMNWNGRDTPVHHVALELDGRPRPEGMEADHICRVRNCVFPGHLRWVTHGDNVRLIPRELVGTANRNKTVCKYGHQLSGDNVRIYVKPDGSSTRLCLACQKRKAKALWEKRKASR